MVVLACWLGGLEACFSIATELHSNVVIWVNNDVYIFGSTTLNTTHVRGKGDYNGWMTLKFGRCVCVRSLHMCTKFHGSRVNSCRENSDWDGGVRRFFDD